VLVTAKKFQEFSGEEKDSLDLWISFVKLTVAQGQPNRKI